MTLHHTRIPCQELDPDALPYFFPASNLLLARTTESSKCLINLIVVLVSGTQPTSCVQACVRVRVYRRAGDPTASLSNQVMGKFLGEVWK